MQQQKEDDGYDRHDMSQWVIHFVHERKADDDMYAMRDASKLEDPNVTFRIPTNFDADGKPNDLTLEYTDNEWPIDSDASAFDLLRKIIHDGCLCSGWSFRDDQPTVYGPYSAVCFTEMPLYALIEYAKKRGKKTGYVGNHGIAFMRKELFDAGARQVIYGLSTEYKEAEDVTDAYYNHGLRCLSEKCGIGLEEQYRYVSTNLGKGKWVDWTHEREWRWPFRGGNEGVAGLPFLLSEGWGYQFKNLVVIVDTDEEQRVILDQLKNMYDSGGRNCGFEYNMSLIPAIRVLSLETLAKAKVDMKYVRIEDVPTLQAEVRTKVAVPDAVRKHVAKAIEEAEKVHDNAVKQFLEEHPGYKSPDYNWGSAGVYTCANTAVTQALLDANIASTYADGKYMFDLGKRYFDDMDLENIGAEAAAAYLSKELEQPFEVYELPD